MEEFIEMRKISIEQFLDAYEDHTMYDEIGELIGNLVSVVKYHHDDEFRELCMCEARKLFLDAVDDEPELIKENPDIAKLEGYNIPEPKVSRYENCHIGNSYYIVLDTEENKIITMKPVSYMEACDIIEKLEGEK